MCKRYGEETQETDEKAGSNVRPEGEPAPDNEDGQEHQDLEQPTRALKIYVLSDWSFSGGARLARLVRPHRSFLTSYHRRNKFAVQRQDSQKFGW
jgi:hypothetical protein